MSSNPPTTIPSAACDPIDMPTRDASDPIQLCTYKPKKFDSPAHFFQRTLEYTQDPTGYLQNVLGAELYAQRKPQLSLPPVVDRDMYGTGAHKEHFEAHIAALLGKRHGLFFVTGVQAQLAALRIHCDRATTKTPSRRRAAWHVSSHLESAEEQAYSQLYGLDRVLLGPDAPDANPSLEAVEAVLKLPQDQRPAVILLEIPNRSLGCQTYAWEELVAISAACRAAGVRLHCDGARLWEIEPFYRDSAGKSFAELGALFDSLYVSFYKGLGGAAGAMLVGEDADFINAARVWQRRAGGNLVTLAYQLLDDERGFNENIGGFAGKRDKMVEVAREVVGATARFTTADGRPVVSFVPARPTCCQVHTLFEGFTEGELVAARDRAQARTGIRVFERLRRKITLDEQMRIERAAKAAGGAGAAGVASLPDPQKHFMEWMIIEHTKALDTKVFVDGYVALCEELVNK